MIPSLLRVLATLLLLLTQVAVSDPQRQTSATGTTTTTSQPLGSTSAAPVACNNSPDLCSRAYNNITHMGAHDSPFVRDATTDYSLAGNQYYNSTVALSAGIRLLQAQVHLAGTTLQLCHTSCDLLDAGPLETWLAAIKGWLDTHPSDVVTLVLVNSDNQPAASFGAAFNRSGISAYGFAPSQLTSGSGSGNDNNTNAIAWPTLQDLIAADARLVTFVASIEPTAQYPYLLNEFDHVFETPWNVTSSTSFTCEVDRPSTAQSAADALSSGLLPLMNHFAYRALTSDILLPAASQANYTNSPNETATGALGQHARQCASEWDATNNSNSSSSNNNMVAPVLVLVDFYDRGPAVDTADRLNGVVAPVGRVSEPAYGSGSGSTWGRIKQRSGKDVLFWEGVVLLAHVGMWGVIRGV